MIWTSEKQHIWICYYTASFYYMINGVCLCVNHANGFFSVAGGTGSTQRRGRRRRNVETFKWPSSSPATTWQLACTTLSSKIRAPPPSASWRSAWKARGDPAMRTPLRPSCRVGMALCTACAKDFLATEAERRIMRTTKGARSGGARWEPSFWGESCENRPTLGPARLWARRAASHRHGVGASVLRPVSVWWCLISPTRPVTAATWQQTTAQVSLLSL